MASVNGRIPILSSVDGAMHGDYPTGDFIPAEELAVELAEYTTRQQDIDDARALLLGMENLFYRDNLELRLNNIYVPARLMLGTPPLVNEWDTRSPHTPLISPNGFYVRSPGGKISFKLDHVLEQNSGWSCIHVDCSILHHITHFGVGDELNLSGLTQDMRGTSAQSVLFGRGIYTNNEQLTNVPNNMQNVVIAINYQTNPTVYAIQGGSVVYEVTLPMTSPVNFVAQTEWLGQRDWVIKVNTGADLINRPMPSGIELALQDHVDTTGFVEGWGASSSSPAEEGEAQVKIDAVSENPAVGQSVSVTATCVDGAGIDRAAEIHWYNNGANWNHAEAFAVGATYSFTPEQPGSYDIVARYYDRFGDFVDASVNVFIDWVENHSSETVFDISRTHPNILEHGQILNNQVRFNTSDPFKISTIANNGNWGNFRYFELQHTTPDIYALFGFGVSTLLN
ncbi:MAG: hypothetical protein COA42_19250, partial [Alteromonadaceae bacterium]